MSKLLHCAAVMVAIFTLTIFFATRLIGNVRSGDIEPPFTNPVGAPTLLGVQPGVTSYGDALELLQTERWTRLVVPKGTGAVFSQASSRVILTRSSQNDQVARIELLPAQNSEWGSFGQIVDRLGPPQRIVVERPYTLSFWRGGLLEFVHVHRMVGWVSLDDPLDSVAVNAQPVRIPGNAVAWQGFGSEAAYLSNASRN